MKKLMSIITMLLVVIGISGCGSSVPTEVTVEPGKMTTLVVGEDIAEGTYTYEVSGSDGEVKGEICSQGSMRYDINKSEGKLYGGSDGYYLPESLILSSNDTLFIQPEEENGTVKIIKEK